MSARGESGATPSCSSVTCTVWERGLWDAAGPAPGSRQLDQARVHVRFPAAHPPWSTEAHEIGKETIEQQDGLCFVDAERAGEQTAAKYMQSKK